MRAGRNEATGTSGESEVMAEFQRLGWAAVLDSRHDTGTDMFLRPRDERRFEMGFLLGAQVKTGKTFFNRPELDSGGNVIGWWFAESNRDHFDDWLSHAIPHLIVLRNQTEGRSYWALITPDSVENTGKGARILVPAANTVDQEHHEALVRAAASRTGGSILEGSAWVGQEVPSRDQIRFALVAPRLIAPHPNAGAVPLTPLQALASELLLRPASDYFFLEDRMTQDARGRGLVAETPTFTEAESSQSWGWRATAAVHEWLRSGDPRHLIEFPGGNDEGAENAASAILRAVGHTELGQPDEAILVLEEALAEDQANPADHAWIQAHLAAALLDVGRRSEAVEFAFRVLQAHTAAPADTTLGALAGSVTDLIFHADGWRRILSDDPSSSNERTVSVGDVVSNSDTAAGWWWSQQLSWALGPTVERVFESWAPDGSVRYFTSMEPTERHLLTARALAAMAANRDDWCHALELLAKHRLAGVNVHSPVESVTELVRMLRLAGEAKAAKRAATRLVLEGPVPAISRVACEIDLTKSTRTTASSDLEILTAAGDLLNPEHVAKLVAWGLELLHASNSEFLQRTRPNFDVRGRVLSLFTSAAEAAGPETQLRLIDYVLERAPRADDFECAALARLAQALPENIWREDQLEDARKLVLKSGTALASTLHRVLASHIDGIPEELLERARNGDVTALEGVDDVRTLPGDAVAALVSALQALTRTLIHDARRGVRSFGGFECVGALTLLNIWHPEHARWDEVVQALREPRVGGSDLNQALAHIAGSATRIAPETKSQLIEACTTLLHREPGAPTFALSDDIRGRALEAIIALGGPAPIAEAIGGSSAQRESVARAIGEGGDETQLPLLMLLASDQAAAVRAAAARSLCMWVCTCRGGSTASNRVIELLATEGFLVARAVASTVLNTDEVSAECASLVEALAASPFARVRAAIARWRLRDPMP